MTTINLTPTWTAAANIYITVLENGNDEGKEIAREEILKMGKLLDELINQVSKLSGENKPQQ